MIIDNPTDINTFVAIHPSRLTQPPSLVILQENFGFIIIGGMPHINKLLLSFAAMLKVIIDVNE